MSPAAEVASAGAWGLGGRATLLLATLLATPFTIRLLGPSRYGLWALLQASITWAALADVGMSTASTKFGADSYARGDDIAESTVIWTALAVTSFTTAFVAVLGAVYAPAIAVHLLHQQGTLLAPAVLALRLVCGLFLVQAVANTINTPQVVRLRWRPYAIINTFYNLLMIVGAPVALALIAGGVVTVSVIGLGAATVGLIGSFVLAARLQPAILHPHFSKSVLRKLLGYGGALAVSGLATVPLATAERFFLANNHSTAMVAYYAVAATLATTLNVLPEQLVGPLLPGLARLEAEGRWQELRSLYRKSLAGLFLTLTPAAILLAFIAQPFLSLWAGPAYGVHSTGPFLIVIVGVWFNGQAWVPASYFLSSGRTKIIAYTQVAEVIPYLAAAYVLTAHFGAIGAAMTWSSLYVLDAVVWFTLAWRVSRLAWSPLPDRGLRAVAVPLLLALATVGAAVISQGFVARLAWALLLGALYFGTVWVFVLTAKERDGLVHLSYELVRKGPAPRHSRRARRRTAKASG